MTPSDPEISLFHTINDWPASLHMLFLAITFVGDITIALLPWMLLAYWLAGRRAGLAIFVAGLSTSVSAQILKSLIERPRPEATLDTINTFDHHYASWSFPSGHSAFAATCAVTVMLYAKPHHRPWLLAIAVLVGVSRIYLGAHFPLDVLAGWTLGTFVVITTYYALPHISRKIPI